MTPTSSSFSVECIANRARRSRIDGGGAPRTRGPWLALTGLAFLGFGTGVEAQADPRVYVVAVAADPELEAVASRVGAASRAALRRQEGVSWVGADQTFLGYDDSTLSTLRRAREHLEECKGSWLELDWESAIESCDASVGDFIDAAAALEDPGDFAEALIYKADAQSRVDRSNEAIGTLELLHVLIPHIQPDPQIFPTELVELYERAAPYDSRNPSGTIRIDSDPPGALAFVDFVARGRTPVEVDGLMAGEHVVRVTRPGAEPYLEGVRVSRRRTARVNALMSTSQAARDLEDIRDALAQDRFEAAQVGTTPHMLASILTLDLVGAVRVSPGSSRDTVELELYFLELAGGTRVATVSAEFPVELGTLEAGVNRMVSATLTEVLAVPEDTSIGVPYEGPGEEGSDDSEGGSIFEEWYFWTAVGGALLIGGTIALIFALDSGEDLGADQGGQIILRFE